MERYRSGRKEFDSKSCDPFIKTAYFHTETYRSGRNELDSKSSCPQGHVGSNPTVSARPEQAGACSGFFTASAPSCRTAACPAGPGCPSPDHSGRKGPLPARCSGAALPGKSSIGGRYPMTWDARCRAAGAAFPPAGRKRKTRPGRESRSGRGTWRRRGFTAAAGGSGRRAGRRRAPPPWGSGRTRPRSGTGRRRP